MVKCSCFDPIYQCCNGTKERDSCNCRGNEKNCDFYPEKREKAKENKTMNTSEMFLEAERTGKMYVVVDGDVAYSTKTGLVDKDDFKIIWKLSMWDGYDKLAFYHLMNLLWEEYNVISKEEAEKRLGVKIIG